MEGSFSRAHPNGPDEKWEVCLHTADKERVGTLHWQHGLLSEIWTLRDLDNQVLTVYTKPDSLASSAWDWKRDYVQHPDGTLLLSLSDEASPRHRHHVATDHLGTPLIVTDGSGTIIHTDALWGFGESFETSGDPPQRRRFTAHERDPSPDGQTLDLDYMHARHYSPYLARFLSVDPTQRSIKSDAPQSWNRYAYGLNSPLKYIDPDGEAARVYSQAGLERSREVRDQVRERVSSIPVVGDAAAGVVDFGLGLILPASREEVEAQAEMGLPTPSIPGAAVSRTFTAVVSRIKSSTTLVRAARSLSGAQQRAVDELVSRLVKGQTQQGLGTRALEGFKGVFELRARNGARVAFRVVEGRLEILAKFNKRTQRRVLEILRELVKE